MRRALTTGSSDGPFPPTACTSANSDMAYYFTDVLSFRSGYRFVWDAVSCRIPLQVYHFTDVPSFRSGSSLCIFDPYARQAAHVPTSALAPSHICAGTGLAPCPHLRRD